MAFQATLVPTNAFEATPSDSTPINAINFYCGVTGDIAVMPSHQRGQPTPMPVTYRSMPAGQVMYLNIDRVMATGTTAQHIICASPI